MKRLSIFLLLIGVVIGLAVQQPARALAAPMGPKDMSATTGSDMAAMPDCMASMSKDATYKPCKCGMAGCIAMMAGASLMLAEGSDAVPAVTAGDRQNQAAKVVALHGRATAPDPEPPSILI